MKDSIPIKPEAALLGAALGAGLGIGGTELLLSHFVAKGDFYAGTALVACLAGAAASLKIAKGCLRPLAQSMTAGLAALAGIAGYWNWRGLPFGRSTLGLAVVVAFACYVVGRTSKAGRR